ncbi:MAG: hypothetical protein ACPL3P_07460 [Anaerolineales bacterium]
MKTRIKDPCSHCHLPYLQGKNGICLACLRGSSPIGLRCECGKPAVAVLQTYVGIDGVYFIEIPLCQECLKLELEEVNQSLRSDFARDSPGSFGS